ncbi:MAG: ketopantoate reductase family protein [Actinobacteria bacterium]|nr:ketopantoate reductase family protein [Actinomycetota bacterium]
MRFIVYGAGAVGGVLGGRLYQHGHDVVLIARGKHGQALRERGLVIESPAGPDTIDVPVVGHPREVDLTSEDVVLLTMKSQDTAGAVLALSECVDDGLPVVCVQNGVDNERLALRHFRNVHGVCVMFPATFVEDGVVQANSAPTEGILDVGGVPAGVDSTTEAISAAFRSAGFVSEPRGDVMRWKHCKLLMNLGNAIEATVGNDARGAELFALAKAEGRRCLEAAGIAYASDDEDAARRAGVLQLTPISGRRRGGGSSWQSLERGTGTVEADHLNGEIVLLGRLWGVSTPVNALLQRLANQCARERREPGSLDAGEVLAMLDRAADA